MSVQTTYPAGLTAALAGMITRAGHRVQSRVAYAATVAGTVCLRRSDTEASQIAATDEPTVDVDAFVASGGASAATAQTVSGAALNGVLGDDAFFPPRNVTLTFNSHADWDTTTAVVTGADHRGNLIQEQLLIPNGGNATVTGKLHFSRIDSIYLPAQSGTGGTFTAGIGVSLGPIDARCAGVAVYDATKTTGTYSQYADLPCLKEGEVAMVSETTATQGDHVYVRFVATGDEVRGQIRNAPDGNDCALLEGARYAETLAAAGTVKVRVDIDPS